MPRSTKLSKTPQFLVMKDAPVYPTERITREFVCSCDCKFGVEHEARLHEVAQMLARDIWSVVSRAADSCDSCDGEFTSPCDWARVVVRGKTLENLEKAIRATIRERKRYTQVCDRIGKRDRRATTSLLRRVEKRLDADEKKIAACRRGGARR